MHHVQNKRTYSLIQRAISMLNAQALKNVHAIFYMLEEVSRLLLRLMCNTSYNTCNVYRCHFFSMLCITSELFVTHRCTLVITSGFSLDNDNKPESESHQKPLW